MAGARLYVTLTYRDPSKLMTTSARGGGEGARVGRGLQLFTRYAYPPNELGFCGMEDHRALLDYGTSGVVDDGLGELARGFTGPWPYLTMMAGELGVEDPFDERLVEAYWIGNDLLRRVSTESFGRTVEEYFRPRSGPNNFSLLAEGIPTGVPHHSFHVFGVYPWVGLLQSGRTDEPLEQLDRCRIRWGQVVAVHGDEVSVRFRPLEWDGTRLSLGAQEIETVTRGLEGQRLIEDLTEGDWVSMHWHWICDRLDARQLRNLRYYSARQLEVTNERVDHSGPGVVLAGG